MRFGVAFFCLVSVGIDHHGPGVFGRLYESLNAAVAERQRGGFEKKQSIARFEPFGGSAHKTHRRGVVGIDGTHFGANVWQWRL